jgi:hypothetical protein
MTLSTLTLPFLWLLNGILAISYLLFDHLLAVVLIAPLTWLTITTKPAQRAWMASASVLALAATALGPAMIGLWHLIIAVASIAAILLERFNPEALRWRVAGGTAIYGLIGLGVTVYKSLAPVIIAGDSLLSQGQAYLSTIISIATVLVPLGIIGVLVQAVWAHPPMEAGPEETIYQVRTRGRR